MMISIIDEVLEARKEYLINSTGVPKKLIVNMDNLRRLHAYYSDVNLIKGNFTRPSDIVGFHLFGMVIERDDRVELHID